MAISGRKRKRTRVRVPKSKKERPTISSRMENKRTSCRLCGLSFNTRPMMLQHKRRKHSKVKISYHCGVEGCTKSGPRKDNILRHRDTRHTADEVSAAGSVSKTKENREDQIDGNSEDIKCELCDEMFVNSEGVLRRHTETVHADQTSELASRIKVFMCPIKGCTSNSEWKCVIKRHMNSAHFCSPDDGAFMIKHRMVFLKERVIEEDSVGIIECKMCLNKKFKGTYAMARHYSRYHKIHNDSSYATSARREPSGSSQKRKKRTPPRPRIQTRPSPADSCSGMSDCDDMDDSMLFG